MDAQYVGCFLCKAFFSKKGFPKIFDCGHSTCFSCLQGLLASKKACPKCDAPLLKQFEDYPISKDLIIANELIEKRNISIHEKLSSLQSILETEIDKKKMTDVSEIFDEIKNSCKNLDKTFLKSNSKSEDDFETKKNLVRIHNPRPKIFLDFDKYQNEEHFIYEIYVRLKEKNLVYACEIVNEVDSKNCHFYQWKYGKLDCNMGCIYIHCLSSSSVDENSTCVTLRDLKRCMEFNDLRLFIDFGFGKKLFTLTNSSFLAMKFLKLCTGENGDMLKGSTARFGCNKNDTVEKSESLAKIINELDATALSYCIFDISAGYRSNVDYDLTKDYLKDTIATFSKNDLIIQSNMKYIYLRDIKDHGFYKNVVAKLLIDDNNKMDLREIKDVKIEDCGIAIGLHNNEFFSQEC